MSRPTDDVGVCNLALDLIKSSIISALTGDNLTKEEALCARWYDTVRQSLLEDYNWNFALFSAAINRAGTPAVSDYTDYYTLPNAYLKLRAIANADIPLTRRKFEIQGTSLLYSNATADTLDIWYTRDMTAVTQWPALFIRLVAAELALVLSKRLTVRPSIMKELKEELIDLRRRARGVDGQIKPPKRYESSKIVNAGLYPSSQRTVAGDFEFIDDWDL